MNLQGRNLELNHRGDDVALLQTELRQLDFQIVDPPGLFGSTTLLAVRRFQTEHRLPVTGVVDARTARRINQEVDAQPRQNWRVQGHVLRPDGQAVAATRVRVFEKRLRRDAALGESTTDAAGAYVVDYPIPTGDISLYVHALSASGERLAGSDVVCHAKPVETIDLAVGEGAMRGRPLFARLRAALQPLLTPDRVLAADLSTDDVHWLACRHGLDEDHLDRYAAAARLAAAAELPREHEAFFGLLMQNLPPLLPALVAQAPRSLRKALEQAMADNEIGAVIASRIDAIIEALQGVIVRLALRAPEPDRPTFALLFDVAGTPAQHREALLTDNLRHTGTLEEFWETQRRRLGNEATDELLHVLRVAALGLNHAPLLRRLMRMRAAGEVGRGIEDLARFDRAAWLRLIREREGTSPIGAPSFLGTVAEDRDNLFATYLARFVEAVAPTRVLAERLASDTSPALAAGVSFLRRQPAFDFRHTRVGAFLRANPRALDGDPDPAATRATLSAMQRLYDLAPPFDKHRTVRLLGQSIDSATQIRRIGEAAFVRRASATLGGAATARAVYARAAQKADTAVLLLSQSAYMNRISVNAVPTQLVGPGIPDLEDLFGSLDACLCLHCNSVCSPAAYLVDTLHFLMNCDSATPGRSALDVLFERRPDLGEVDLTCDNTHITLPYLDLVVEVLENAVAPGGGFPFQTVGDSSDLLASPAHVQPAAYDPEVSRLGGALYPWSLPFDLWTEIARSYLQHMGVPRHELMQSFRAAGDEAAAADVAAEYLGLTQADRNALVLATPTSRRRFWGFADAAGLNAFVQGRNAGALLRRARMSYDELVAVLAVRFVDAAGRLRIEFEGADCDLDTATIVNLDAPALDRLHHFMRLRCKLPWRIEELGALLRSLSISSLDDQAVMRIAEVQRLQQGLGLPLRTVLGWWVMPMDTHGIGSDLSLYDDVYLDPTASRPETDVFRLNEARSELRAANTALISAHLPQVHAALGISGAELDLLRAELSNDRLNLRNLTLLHAFASLARALHLRVADYLSLRALSGLQPVGPTAGPAVTTRFVELSREVSVVGVSYPLLDYLLRHRFTPNASFALADDQIALHLAVLQTAMRLIDVEFALAPAGMDPESPNFEADPDATRTATQLAALVPEDAVRQALALVEGESSVPLDAQANFIQQVVGPFLNPDEAIERLVGPGTLILRRDRFNYVLGALLTHRRRTRREAAVVARIADMLSIEAGLSDSLLRSHLRAPADTTQAIIVDLIDDQVVGAISEPAPEPTRAVMPGAFAALERLHKLVQAAKLLGLPDSMIRFALEQGPSRGWVDLGALPLGVTGEAQPGLETFLSMAAALRAGAALSGGWADFQALLQAQDSPGMARPGYLDEVALRTGWDRTSVEFVAGDQVLGLSWPQGFRSGAFLTAMQPRMAMLARLGVAATTAQTWSTMAASMQAAQTIVQTARAKYPSKDAWLAVARPLRDPLRERQRAALVDLLVHRLGLESPNDLYGHYLIDVEMSPCMLTSRMVLATASVQLFVQRCLLNLEAEVPPSAIDTGQWDWMKNYRVWEANRKVFLYPENWIEPELRDDKSPPFLALEQGLLQDDVNSSTVERAYLAYLNALDQVANLEIVALCIGPYGSQKNVIHVFGRTRNQPHSYFYRRWNRASWSPWEPMDVGIEGDHLVPVFWNGRLTVFWPVFMEKATEPSEADLDPDTPKKPSKYHDVSLAWSEWREGTWSPKRMTEKAISSIIRWDGPDDKHITHEPAKSFSVVSSQGDGGIEIGLLVRPPGILTPEAFEHSLLEAFNLTEGGVVDSRTAASTRTKRWPAQRQFPGAQLSGNALDERPPGGFIAVPSAGFSVLTTSNATSDKAVSVLARTPGRFKVTFPEGERPFFCRLPFFYQDPTRCFVVVPDGRYLAEGNGGSRFLNELTAGVNPTHTTSDSRQPRPNLSTRATAFHADVARTALASSSGPLPTSADAAVLPGHWETTRFHFQGHYHPFVRLLIEQLGRFGIDGILKPKLHAEPSLERAFGSLRRQELTRPFFWADYSPNRDVVENVFDVPPNNLAALVLLSTQPRDDFDFSYGGAYSLYNWELFFHAPFLIAKRLSVNRRFSEANRWFNYIFDPTDAVGEEEASTLAMADRAWNIKPFVEHSQGRSIEKLLLLLRQSGLSHADRTQRDELNAQVQAWRANPFNPHLIARMRVQPYLMAVVMAYMDNLIAWGDDLFRRDTMESINEASQIYILAAEVLGDRPRETAAHDDARRTVNGQAVTNFNDLRGRLDSFSNALVELETMMHPAETDLGAAQSGGLLHADDFVARASPSSGHAADLGLAPPPIPSVVGTTLFFCVPRNEKLLGYWDTVADRLFKIRHCMNIEGVVRQLPLFQPPIDPALLVRAVAAGVDLGSALSSISPSRQIYRFQVLAQKAHELAGDVERLGSALIDAIEKRDVEELATLRSAQEVQLLSAMREIKSKQIEEARANKSALLSSREAAVSEWKHYQRLLGAKGAATPDIGKPVRNEKPGQLVSLESSGDAAQRPSEGLFSIPPGIKMLEYERIEIDQLAISQAYLDRASERQRDVARLSMLPGFSSTLSVAPAGIGLSISVSAGSYAAWDSVMGEFFRGTASEHAFAATLASKASQLVLREDEWVLRNNMAANSIMQIDKQLAANDVRIELAEKELRNHELQRENATAVDSFLHRKNSNADLYGWMISQISSVYFQSFQLAQDLSRRAESAFRSELGLLESNYVQNGHWDSLKKGLLAGEKLRHDLRRMEAAYLAQDRREHEITKHISLRQLDPQALLALKANGQCEFDLPEWLFDLDGPGHFMRRIKTVSLSLPCVVGPQVSVNCTARLLRSQVRTTALASGTYAQTGAEDPRFATYLGTVESVVTSGASNDSGLFETNLRDERYLPFEGSGAIGRWRLELPAEFRQFDYMTIADAVLHMRYTARDGGQPLRQAAVGHLGVLLQATEDVLLTHLVSLRQDFPGEWQRFVAGEDLVLRLGRGHFPYIAQGRTIEVRAVEAWTPNINAQAPTSFSAGQLGLNAFPSMTPGQADPFELRMTEPIEPITRTPELRGFLLLRYVIL